MIPLVGMNNFKEDSRGSCTIYKHFFFGPNDYDISCNIRSGARIYSGTVAT